jgi:hypothetical protein
MPSCCCIIAAAATTLGRLSRGSPIPMNTAAWGEVTASLQDESNSARAVQHYSWVDAGCTSLHIPGVVLTAAVAAAMPAAVCAVSQCAASTAGLALSCHRTWHGDATHSPTLLARWPCSSLTASTWSRISCAARLRAKPPLPVAQKVQRIGQPTWRQRQGSRAGQGRDAQVIVDVWVAWCRLDNVNILG